MPLSSTERVFRSQVTRCLSWLPRDTGASYDSWQQRIEDHTLEITHRRIIGRLAWTRIFEGWWENARP